MLAFAQDYLQSLFDSSLKTQNYGVQPQINEQTQEKIEIVNAQQVHSNTKNKEKKIGPQKHQKPILNEQEYVWLSYMSNSKLKQQLLDSKKNAETHNQNNSKQTKFEQGLSLSDHKYLIDKQQDRKPHINKNAKELAQKQFDKKFSQSNNSLIEGGYVPIYMRVNAENEKKRQNIEKIRENNKSAVLSETPKENKKFATEQHVTEFVENQKKWQSQKMDKLNKSRVERQSIELQEILEYPQILEKSKIIFSNKPSQSHTKVEDRLINSTSAKKVPEDPPKVFKYQSKKSKMILERESRQDKSKYYSQNDSQ